MTARPQNTLAIQRSIARMTLGTMSARERRRARDAAEALSELDQQFQLPIAGAATDAPVWFDVDINFSARFIDAPEMRESPYDEPLFTYGVKTGARVFVDAHLVSYETDDNDSFIGAKIRIGVHAPGSPDLIPFKGEVHLNFQGFAAVDEADTSED